MLEERGRGILAALVAAFASVRCGSRSRAGPRRGPLAAENFAGRPRARFVLASPDRGLVPLGHPCPPAVVFLGRASMPGHSCSVRVVFQSLIRLSCRTPARLAPQKAPRDALPRLTLALESLASHPARRTLRLHPPPPQTASRNSRPTFLSLPGDWKPYFPENRICFSNGK